MNTSSPGWKVWFYKYTYIELPNHNTTNGKKLCRVSINPVLQVMKQATENSSCSYIHVARFLSSQVHLPPVHTVAPFSRACALRKGEVLSVVTGNEEFLFLEIQRRLRANNVSLLATMFEPPPPNLATPCTDHRSLWHHAKRKKCEFCFACFSYLWLLSFTSDISHELRELMCARASMPKTIAWRKMDVQ